jgi:septal ring factor EnvC (AmiA/AmiB activator)
MLRIGMFAELSAPSPESPWWAILVVSLIGPAGLGAIAVQLGRAWLTQRRDEAAALLASRKVRDKEREDERKAIAALPGQMEALTKAITDMGDKLANRIDATLAEVTRAEAERANADRDERKNMASLMMTIAQRMPLSEPPPAPPSTGVRRMMGSSPGR